MWALFKTICENGHSTTHHQYRVLMGTFGYLWILVLCCSCTCEILWDLVLSRGDDSGMTWDAWISKDSTTRKSSSWRPRTQLLWLGKAERLSMAYHGLSWPHGTIGPRIDGYKWCHRSFIHMNIIYIYMNHMILIAYLCRRQEHLSYRYWCAWLLHTNMYIFYRQ